MKARNHFIVAVLIFFGLIAFVSEAAAAPAVISSCKTITAGGSYILSTNLTATSSTGNCIITAADDITIDLNGFTITGKGSIGTAVITNGDAYGNLIVKNGTIRKFRHGIDVVYDNITVEGVHFFDIVLWAVNVGRGSTVKDCYFYKSGTAVKMFDGEGSIVSGNLAFYSSDGIMVPSGGCTISGNSVYYHGGVGISAGAGSTVSNNTAIENGTGMSVTCPSNVFDNALTNNGTNLVLNGEGCLSTNNVAP
ncbi:MAG: hypothetical protein LLG06_20045 [Desulfobacteraceae bacterium]|nr:hypothetical protein [Desulfobacteraceae bacterium]